MTIKQDIQQDTVAMRWVRTAATTVTAVAAAVAVLWTGAIWVLGPRVTEWAEGLVAASTAEQRRDIAQTSAHLERLDQVVERLEQTTAQLAETSLMSTAPSWRFDPVETMISDGRIGGQVRITAAGYKLRDCGTPVVDLYFINGGGVYHRFTETSLLTEDGRGIALPALPDRVQEVRYTAVIPADDGVMPGRAQGYIAVTYPDACPFVEPAVAGPLQFRIEPAQ